MAYQIGGIQPDPRSKPANSLQGPEMSNQSMSDDQINSQLDDLSMQATDIQVS